MGTRSVIARPTPDGGFAGVYGHDDGDPARQGRALFEAVTGHVDGDPDAAGQDLIDQHPAGWSVLAGGCSVPPGDQHHPDPGDRRNQCFCHGERTERPRPPLDADGACAAGLDDADVRGPERLTVLTNRSGWLPVAEPAWTDTPDWSAIDHHARQLQRWGPP